MKIKFKRFKRKEQIIGENDGSAGRRFLDIKLKSSVHSEFTSRKEAKKAIIAAVNNTKKDVRFFRVKVHREKKLIAVIRFTHSNVSLFYFFFIDFLLLSFEFDSFRLFDS